MGYLCIPIKWIKNLNLKKKTTEKKINNFNNKMQLCNILYNKVLYNKFYASNRGMYSLHSEYKINIDFLNSTKDILKFKIGVIHLTFAISIIV